MRTLQRNKRVMYYSLMDGQKPAYERDENGEIQYYEDEDGNKIPLETGQTVTAYSLPVEMQGNIAFSGGEIEEKEFGFSVSDYDATLVTALNEYPLTETSILWYGEEPKYKDEANTEIDDKSATFRVVAIKPSLNYSKYLLRKITK